MRNIYTRLILLIFGVSAGLVSCIHDETTGFVREISEITITRVFGEGVNEDGSEANVNSSLLTRIEAEVEQTLEGYELSYEWRAGYITGTKDNKPVLEDSLRYISTEPVLEYGFGKEGSYLLRLRVYNEFGSTFHYMTVNVRAGMERGLVVLSSDETKQGRLSFCPTVVSADELFEASAEDFDTGVWERLNLEYELTDPRGMIETFTSAYSGLYILSKGQKCIYMLNKKTLGVLAKLDLTVSTLDWDMEPVAFGALKNWNDTRFLVLSENGEWAESSIAHKGLLSKYAGNGDKGKKYVKIVCAMHQSDYFSFGINLENEQIACSDLSNSGDTFKGEEIINCTWGTNDGLCVVSKVKADDKIKVTQYNQLKIAENGLAESEVFNTGVLSANTFALPAELTLTRETDLLRFKKNEDFVLYYKGNNVYRWDYKALPEKAACTVPAGEITCMASSPDEKYLYVGTYDAGAAGLKGNVYIYEVKTFKLVKSFVGVADKPVQLYYKDSSN